MRRKLYPFFDKDEDYVLPEGSIYAIGSTFGNTEYTYNVCKWANGKVGAIVDFYEVLDEVDTEGKSLFGGKSGHRDELYFVSSNIDLVHKSESSLEMSDLLITCPLVAKGIIARFLKTSPIRRNYPAMFDEYYQMEKDFYAIERQMTDPYTFNVNLGEEFDNGIHLREEKEKINYSIQHLFPYLQKKHHTQIIKTAEAYIAFVKSKATKNVNSQSNEGNVCGNNSNNIDNNVEKNYKRYSFQLNVNQETQERILEALYVSLSKRDEKGKRFIDGDLIKNNEVDKEILSYFETTKDESVRNTAVNKYLFNQVFSGQETDVHIVWTGNANELWYLIYKLYNYYIEKKVEGGTMIVRLLEKSGMGPGIWQIVCSRFLNGKKRKVLDERTGIMVETNEPIEFKETEFHKYSEKNSPRYTSMLDAIINKIAPPRPKTDKEAIEEDTDPWAYGIKSPNNSEELDGNFHDTNHKGRFE